MMELKQAEALAEEIVGLLGPDCARIEVVGSIRRRRPFPRDIDILLIPANQGKLAVALQATATATATVDAGAEGDAMNKATGVSVVGQLPTLAGESCNLTPGPAEVQRVFHLDKALRMTGSRIPEGAIVRVLCFFPRRRVMVEYHGEAILTMLWCLRKKP